MRISTKSSNKESHYSQSSCEDNVIGQGSWNNRHQAQKVSYENKKENSKQIRHVALVLFVSYIRLGNLITYKNDKCF